MRGERRQSNNIALDIFNELKEQLSSCPERTRALCRTVWGAVSTSLSTALTAASIEAGDDRDDGGGVGGGGGRGRGGGGGSSAVGGWCTTLTSTTAASANGGASGATAGSTGGRFATIMGAVKSRSISNADVERDEPHHYQHQQQQQQHSSHSMLRNGHHHSATGTGGTLQKQDLRYDIGSSSQYHHVRQPSVRSRSQQPMPTTDELDRRFAKVLVSVSPTPMIILINF